MTLAVSGESITFNDSSTQASAQLGMKNRIIDGGFIINQRGYVSGTSLSSGTYGHDRWKGGASAGTYTFTQGSSGVNTTITITAGSIIQVIEGSNLAEGGTYVLSWTGTAQGRLNSGTFGSSGTVTVTGWVAGTNLNVEFNTGTCGNVQLEKGSTATSFDYRPYGTELALCQRYYARLGSYSGGGLYTAFASGLVSASTAAVLYLKYPVNMRATPTINQSTTAINDNTVQAVTAMSTSYAGTDSAYVGVTASGGGLTTNRGCLWHGNNSASAYADLTAEL